LRAVQLLLGHTKIESTVRYLGIEVDDALAIARRDADRFRQAAALMNDEAIEETLRVRAAELETLARALEDQAAKLIPR
jgi:hypothetical protein